jgi:hypothetical protein
LSRRWEYSPDLRFVARRRISDGVETFEILGPETETFKRQNSYNPDILDISMGVSNLFVPATGFVLAACSMILRYIHARSYDPPLPFWGAVMASSLCFANGGLVISPTIPSRNAPHKPTEKIGEWHLS